MQASGVLEAAGWHAVCGCMRGVQAPVPLSSPGIYTVPAPPTPAVSAETTIIIIIIKGHSLRRACLQPATNTQNSKPRPPTTNAKEN